MFELLTFLQTPLHTEIQAGTQSSVAQDWQVHPKTYPPSA